MKSKIDELAEKAFYHALNYFEANDRGVDHQRLCIQQLMEITGFDFDICLNKIQNPILSLLMARDTIGIGESVIKNNLQMVTQSIHNHLSNVQINYYQKTFDQKSSNSILSCKDIIEKTTNAPHGNLLSDVRIIDISKSNVKNEDIGVLVQYLQYQRLNLDKFDVSNNLLGYGAVENLFYTFRLGSPTATYNIKYMNLSNNQIGDDGAKYISSHLSAGLHPNLRCLDVSGNPTTEKSYVHFAESFKSDTVKEMVVILKIANTLPEIKEFFSKGFKYYINEINKYVSNFPTDKIRSNLDVDKWKECKELGVNVGDSMIEGFVKGGIITKSIQGGLFSAVKEAVIDNILTPEALYCYIDTKELVGEALHDHDCIIF